MPPFGKKKIVAPDHYSEFACIADRCVHTCCAGWEIDIDDASLERYSRIKGRIGERLSENIVYGEGSVHFRLTEDDRCPFLNASGLCEIITELGDNELCDICRLHPRFRNFFEDRIEIGLGLCCEEACRIVLARTAPMRLMVLEEGDMLPNENEERFFAMRRRLFDTVQQDRTEPFDSRADALLRLCGIRLPQHSAREWAAVYSELDILDNKWRHTLDRIADAGFSGRLEVMRPEGDLDAAYENLLISFMYRHMADGLYDGTIYARIAFSVLSVYMIRAAASVSGDKGIDGLCGAARMYSSEIEYSEENLSSLIDMLC